MAIFTPFTKASSVLTSIVKAIRSFLLIEDGFHLLQEDSNRIVIDYGSDTPFTPTTKN